MVFQEINIRRLWTSFSSTSNLSPPAEAMLLFFLYVSFFTVDADPLCTTPPAGPFFSLFYHLIGFTALLLYSAFWFYSINTINLTCKMATSFLLIHSSYNASLSAQHSMPVYFHPFIVDTPRIYLNSWFSKLSPSEMPLRCISL